MTMWRQPGLFGDDTHVVVTRLKVVLCVGRLAAWPIDRCSNMDAGRSESETRPLCEPSRTKTDRKRKRQTERETREKEIISERRKIN